MEGATGQPIFLACYLLHLVKQTVRSECLFYESYRKPPVPKMAILTSIKDVQSGGAPGAGSGCRDRVERRWHITYEAAPVLFMLPLAVKPSVPQMVVLTPVKDIRTAGSPGAGGGSRSQYAAYVLFIMPVAIEPTVP
jgi:hypothetical protein